MSRGKRQGFNWGIVLKEFRLEADLSQDDIGKAIGYSRKHRPSGNVSDIEHGKLPIAEDKIRLWVAACHKNMADFYYEAYRLEFPHLIKTPTDKP